jgi:hypothetical protein
MNSDPLENQALEILEFLNGLPFEQCASITREFTNLTANASIYAIRHREFGLLYLGKTRYTRERFRGGHKAFLWSWLDYYNPDDVRILIYPLDAFQLQMLSSQLEAIIIAAANPPYNVRYPARH